MWNWSSNMLLSLLNKELFRGVYPEPSCVTQRSITSKGWTSSIRQLKLQQLQFPFNYIDSCMLTTSRRCWQWSYRWKRSGIKFTQNDTYIGSSSNKMRLQSMCNHRVYLEQQSKMRYIVPNILILYFYPLHIHNSFIIASFS